MRWWGGAGKVGKTLLLMPEIDRTILEAFLVAGDTPVSGDKIARELGLSRVSVWGRLERLRREGFVFEASTRVGYRMTRVPERLHAALVAARVRLLSGRELPLLGLEAVDSTNSEAERQLAAGREPPFGVLAAVQTAGRGRLGRVWHSKDNGNLYLSLAFRPLLAPERMQMFTLVMGVRLGHFLAERFGLKMQVKWPNDLLCDGRKLAGILTEARIDADHVRDLVFGIGINLNAREKDFPPELRATAGSLALAVGKPLDPHRTAAEIIAHLLASYEKFVAEGKGADFAELWTRYDFLCGKKVTVSMLGKELAGTVAGLDESGALLLRDSKGNTHALNAGEVTLKKK